MKLNRYQLKNNKLIRQYIYLCINLSYVIKFLNVISIPSEIRLILWKNIFVRTVFFCSFLPRATLLRRLPWATNISSILGWTPSTFSFFQLFIYGLYIFSYWGTNKVSLKKMVLKPYHILLNLSRDSFIRDNNLITLFTKYYHVAYIEPGLIRVAFLSDPISFVWL